jgi:streptogramin lyase
VYVTDGYSGVVAIDPADGVLYRIPVGTGTAGPFGITIGKNGKIYVTTPGSGVVSVLTPSPSPNIA